MAGHSVPRWIIYTIVIVMALSLLPLAMVAKARVSKMSQPRIHLIEDMGRQPKYKAQALDPVFADRRAMRPEIPGTVARGKLREDDHFERGRVGEDWAQTFPMKVTKELLDRGEKRFNIYCAPCHGLGGEGDGPVHQRAVRLQEPKWIQPLSLTSDQVRERPVGHIFNTITHGIRTMASYGEQIPPEDRWAIVSYVRALQLSRRATMDDVPLDQREALK